MKTRLILFIFALVFFLNIISATDIAYIVRDVSSPNADFIQSITELNYTYTLIDDSQVVATNFSNYKMILVGNEVFSNPSAIPITQKKSLVVTSRSTYVELWKFADYTNAYSTTQYTEARIRINNSITENISSPVKLYSQKGIYAYQLAKMPYRAVGLSNIVATNNFDERSIIGLLSPGDALYGGGIANAKTVFFGITETPYWTAESKKLFKNSLTWLILGEDFDGDGFWDNDCNDFDPTINPNATEIPYDGIDNDCVAGDLVDVDNDGFNSEIVGGNDCDDNDETYNINSTDLTRNCINDAPYMLASLPIIQWNEDGNYTLPISDYFADPEGDELIFGIAYTSENKNITVSFDGELMVFTSAQDWFGDDWAIFNVSDGENTIDSDNITLRVNAINDAPVLSVMENISVFVGEFIAIVPIATDVDSTDLSFTFSSPLNSSGEWQTASGDEGKYTATITVSDGFLTDSETITLLVQDPYPPMIELIYPKNITITDSRNVEFKFRATDETATHLNCQLFLNGVAKNSKNVQNSTDEIILASGINDGVYDWNVRCSDSSYSSFAIENETFVLSAPDIPILNPIGSKSILENETLTFIISGNDIDEDNLTYRATGLPEGATFIGQTFFWTPTFEQSGVYYINFIVDDGTEFTDSEMVKITVLNVKLPPQFSDVDVCKLINNKIDLEIKNHDKGDNFEIGDTIDIELKIKNNLDEDLDFDLEAHLYDLEDEESIEYVKSNLEVDEGDSESADLELTIPNDIPDGDFVIFVSAQDGDYCAQTYVSINIERPDDMVIIEKINADSSVSKGEIALFDIDVKNIGKDTKDEVYVVMINSELEINMTSKTFELEEFGEDDSYDVKFSLEIPEDTEEKAYDFEFVVFFDGDKLEKEIKRIIVRKSTSVLGAEKSDSEGTLDGKDFLPSSKVSIRLSPVWSSGELNGYSFIGPMEGEENFLLLSLLLGIGILTLIIFIVHASRINLLY